MKLTGTPEMLRKIPKSRLLIIVNHPTNEQKWFVDVALLSEEQLILAMWEAPPIISFNGQRYLPLPVVEAALGYQLTNYRQAIAKHLVELAKEPGTTGASD